MEIDVYLPCESYLGHNESPSEGFTTFTDEKGENYFTMVGKDGSVLLRSESYPTISIRDNGLATVKKNREIKERYKIIEDGGQWYVSLKSGNHQEIARSCGYGSEADALARFSFLKEGSTDDFTWNIVPVVVTAPVAGSFIVDQETAGGIGKWLPWLLGVLLLVGLFWWLMKSCNKPASDVIIADTTVIQADTTSSSVPVDTISAEVSLTPAATTGPCNCSGNAESIFNIPTDKVAKKLPRLGLVTNPEFARYGDIHKMNNTQFLELLKSRVAKSDVDKAFLNRVTKAMGYSNGISDVSAANVSEHTFQVGTKGNLGWGASHNTTYNELPDAERDRKAFKIAGNGGCSIYFMKTCGNHMVPFTNCD